MYINLSSNNNLFFYFLNDNIGMVGESVTLDNVDAWSIYYENYYKMYADNLNNAISSLQENVIDKLFKSSDLNQLTDDFAFEIQKSGNGNVSFSKDINDEFKSILFENKFNQSDSGYAYIKLKEKTNASNYISNLLFGINDYKDLSQQFNITEIPSGSELTSSLFDSKKDATMVFWTKIGSNKTYNDDGLFSISNDKSNEAFYFEDDDAGFISKTNLIQQIQFRNDSIKNKTDEWIMWSIKFDNHNTGKLGLHITVYGYDNNKISVNELNNSVFSISYPNLNFDYITRMTDDFFKNSVFRFGYSYKKSYNQLQKNEQFYNGRLRNLIFFKGHLTQKEERGLFKKGILSNYTWNFDYDDDQLYQITSETNSIFFLGLVGIYDCGNVLIQNCLTNFGGKIYNLTK